MPNVDAGRVLDVIDTPKISRLCIGHFEMGTKCLIPVISGIYTHQLYSQMLLCVNERISYVPGVPSASQML